MLCVIIGVPNAGKTTYSKRYDNVIHLDDVGRTERICELIRQMGDDVIVEGAFASPSRRERLINAYTGNHKRCVFLDVTFEESVRREDRGRPNWMLRNAFKHFEPPTLDEGWDEIIIIRGNDEQRINRQTED